MKKTFNQWLDLLKFKDSRIIFSSTMENPNSINTYVLENKDKLRINVGQESYEFIQSLNKQNK